MMLCNYLAVDHFFHVFFVSVIVIIKGVFGQINMKTKKVLNLNLRYRRVELEKWKTEWMEEVVRGR